MEQVTLERILEYKGMIFDLDGTLTPPIDFIHNFKTINQTMVLLMGKLPYKPGAADFLKLLRKHKKPIALASNTNGFIISLFRNNKAMKKVLPIDKAFDVIITKNMVKRGKPRPDLFLRALKELGLDAKDCLAFEDSLRGVKSARAAGLDVCIIDGTHIPKKERAKVDALGTYKIKRYSEILPPKPNT